MVPLLCVLAGCLVRVVRGRESVSQCCAVVCVWQAVVGVGVGVEPCTVGGAAHVVKYGSV